MIDSGGRSKEQQNDSTVPEVGVTNEEINSSFVTPKKAILTQNNLENLDTAETLAHLKETLRNGRYGRFSSSNEGDIFSHNPTRFTPKLSSPSKQRKNTQSNYSQRLHSSSVATLPSRYGSSYGSYGSGKSSLQKSKYSYPNYGLRASHFPVGNSRENINVSLYKYLDDNRDHNPSNPLNYRDIYGSGYSPYEGINRSSSVKGFTKDFKNQLKEKGRLFSPMEYNFNSYGQVSRSIATPQQYKIGDRGLTYQKLIFRFPELDKKGFKVEEMDKELSINKDLLKTGQGYLDVCKGLLDSIRAVKVGDVRYAQNLMTKNRVILGHSSAKKGKEFLKRDHGIDIDNYQPKTDRFILTKVAKVGEVEDEKQSETEPVVNSFTPLEQDDSKLEVLNNSKQDETEPETKKEALVDTKLSLTESQLVQSYKPHDESISHANYEIESVVSSGLPSAKGKKFGDFTYGSSSSSYILGGKYKNLY